jgi:hypothetical protein
MKFPSKTIKLKPGNVPSPNNSLRREFLEDLPLKTRNTVRGVDLTLINEAITAITEGHATINGKMPDTREKRFIVIASYFKTARTPLNMFFDGALNVQNNYTVAFKFKDQPVTVKFPTVLAEN